MDIKKLLTKLAKKDVISSNSDIEFDDFKLKQKEGVIPPQPLDPSQSLPKQTVPMQPDPLPTTPVQIDYTGKPISRKRPRSDDSFLANFLGDKDEDEDEDEDDDLIPLDNTEEDEFNLDDDSGDDNSPLNTSNLVQKGLVSLPPRMEDETDMEYQSRVAILYDKEKRIAEEDHKADFLLTKENAFVAKYPKWLEPDENGENRWANRKIKGISPQLHAFDSMPGNIQELLPIIDKRPNGWDEYEYAMIYNLGEPFRKKIKEDSYRVDQRIQFFSRNPQHFPPDVFETLKANNWVYQNQKGEYNISPSISKSKTYINDPDNIDNKIIQKVVLGKLPAGFTYDNPMEDVLEYNVNRNGESVVDRFLAVLPTNSLGAAYAPKDRNGEIDISKFKNKLNVEDMDGHRFLQKALSDKSGLLNRINGLIWNDGMTSHPDLIKYISQFMIQYSSRLIYKDNNKFGPIKARTRDIDLSNDEGSYGTLAVTQDTNKEELDPSYYWDILKDENRDPIEKRDAVRKLKEIKANEKELEKEEEKLDAYTRTLLGYDLEDIIQKQLINEDPEQPSRDIDAWLAFADLQIKSVKRTSNLSKDVVSIMREMASKNNNFELDFKADYVELLSNFTDTQIRNLASNNEEEIKGLALKAKPGEPFIYPGTEERGSLKFVSKDSKGYIREIEDYSSFINKTKFQPYINGYLEKRKLVTEEPPEADPSEIANKFGLSVEDVNRYRASGVPGYTYAYNQLSDKKATWREKFKDKASDVMPAVFIAMVRDQNGKDPSQHKYPPQIRRNLFNLIGSHLGYVNPSSSQGRGGNSWFDTGSIRNSELFRTIMGYHKDPESIKKDYKEKQYSAWGDMSDMDAWRSSTAPVGGKVFDYMSPEEKAYYEKQRLKGLALSINKIKTAYVKESSTLIKMKNQMSKYNYAHSSMKFIDEKISMLQNKYASIVRKHIEKAYADKHS